MVPTFDETQTLYNGRKVRCAVVMLGLESYPLKLGDTQRCAQDLGACERVLRVLATVVGADPDATARYATGLNIHCRALTRWVERPKRDLPKRSRFFLGR